MDTTVENHVVSLRQEGLSELSKKLDEGYEKYVKEMSINVNKIVESIEGLRDNLADNYDRTSNGFEDLFRLLGLGLVTTQEYGINTLSTDINKILESNIQGGKNKVNADTVQLEQNREIRKEMMKLSGSVQKSREEAEQQLANQAKLLSGDAEDIKADSLLKAVNKANELIGSDTNNISKKLTAIVNSVNNGNGEKYVTKVIEDSIVGMETNIQKIFDDPQNKINEALSIANSTLSKIQNIFMAKSGGNRIESIENYAKQIATAVTPIKSQLDKTQKEETKKTALETAKRRTGLRRDLVATSVSGKPSGTAQDTKYDSAKTNVSSTAKYGKDEMILDGYNVKPQNTNTWNRSEGELVGASDYIGVNNSDLVVSNPNDIIVGDSTMIVDSNTPLSILTDDTPLTAALEYRGYASGTTSAKKGVARVFEEGPEIINTKNGTFIPFRGGEGVVPAEQTRSLINLANSISNGSLKLQMPDMSAYHQVPEVRNNIINNNDIHIDSLVTINGNADATTADQLKQIAQNLVNNRQFGERMTEIVSRRQAQDGRMAGKRVTVK